MDVQYCQEVFEGKHSRPIRFGSTRRPCVFSRSAGRLRRASANSRRRPGSPAARSTTTSRIGFAVRGGRDRAGRRDHARVRQASRPSTIPRTGSPTVSACSSAAPTRSPTGAGSSSASPPRPHDAVPALRPARARSRDGLARGRYRFRPEQMASVLAMVGSGRLPRCGWFSNGEKTWREAVRTRPNYPARHRRGGRGGEGARGRGSAAASRGLKAASDAETQTREPSGRSRCRKPQHITAGGF